MGSLVGGLNAEIIESNFHNDIDVNQIPKSN